MSKQPLPFDLQEKVNRLQALINQIQQVNIQGQRFQLDLADSEQALKVMILMNPEGGVFVSIGAGIQVEKDIPTVIDELETKIKFMQLRIKTLGKQEQALTERATSLQKELKQAIPQRPS